MASRLEQGMEVPDRIERVVRRSANVRDSSMGVASLTPGAASSGGEPPAPDSPVGMLGAGNMSTSRLLDIQSWITNLVEERLALELERRGLSGDRW